MSTIQDLIIGLQNFWASRGCAIHHGHDVEMGAGTFNPATFFRCLGPEPYRAAYVEPSRRPKDGRYGDNPNRMQLFHQYQVIFKPSPPDIQELYLQSLEAVGFKLQEHDIRFVHDDWEQPTLGAWGLGWEVWRDGMEITQFTYFQNVGGQELSPITVELTYGIERLAMVVQGVDNVYDLMWNDTLTYRDIFHRNEVEWSTYNFEQADTEMWFRNFQSYEGEALRLLEKELPLPAYDFVMKASHAFNLLDARGVISVTERTGYIHRIRDLSCRVAEIYIASREAQGFPLLKPASIEPIPRTAEPVVEVPFDPAFGEDFVLEIGSEELPATFIPIGCRNLQTDLGALLKSEGLHFDTLKVDGTPRRLTATVANLRLGRLAEKVEKRGPSLEKAYDETGAPTQAAIGFFRSLGQTPPAKGEADIRGDYLYGVSENPPVSTAAILAEALPKLILGLDFPKKMRWGDGEIAYARPLHWIVALHGDRVISFAVGDVISNRISSAHAQLCPGTFSIPDASTYFETLRDRGVLVNIDERKEHLLRQLSTIEEKAQGQILFLDQVLKEVLFMTEYPQLATGTFDPSFLEIPQDVLTSEMVHHQKYFPLVDPQGRLMNTFVITADNVPSDEIRKGNTKVLSARLSDGKFLYEQDLKHPLSFFNEKLKAITFREGLGTLHDKAERLVSLVETLHEYLQLGDLETAKRAALLSKADLATELVGEFPELQGTIGKHYALSHGENIAVAQAIEEHYMPRGDQGALPSTSAGILLALADRFDNLISCFSLGLKPTSSSDPYALRRQVLGIVRIAIHHKLRFPLDKIVDDELLSFFTNRIKTVFQEFGLTKDETEASLTAPVSDLHDTYCRAAALHTFRTSDSRFPLLVEVFKRARGQLETAGEKKRSFKEKRLKEEAERELYASLQAMEKPFSEAVASCDYTQAYALLADLQQPLSHLFDEVRILDEDASLQENRLALIQKVFSLFDQLLDFSKLRLK